jgi:hypothetical protein
MAHEHGRPRILLLLAFLQHNSELRIQNSELSTSVRIRSARQTPGCSLMVKQMNKSLFELLPRYFKYSYVQQT